MSSNIFISYAHTDKNEKWFEELIQQFESLEIPFWIDKDIQGGQKWREEIDTAIQSASIYVLIITPAFMKSKYINDFELPRIKENKDGIVYPILAKKCAYLRKFPWLGDIQCGGGHAEPLEKLGDNLNDHLTALVEELDELLKQQPPFSKKITKTKPAQKSSLETCAEKPQPNILPYLVDRLELLREMLLSLKKYKENQPDKPLIWIIHGDENQCHMKMRDCIEKWHWQDYLYAGPYERAGLKIAKMRPLPFDKDQQEWQFIVATELRNELKIKKENPSEIFHEVNRMCHESRPILISCVINTSEWVKYGKDKIYKQLMHFWNQWPPLNSQNPLIICFFVRYTPYSISPWKQLFKKQKNDPNIEFKHTISSWKNKDHWSVIELKNISKGDTEAWYDKFKEYIEQHCSHPDVYACIKQIFPKIDGELPMDELVEQINQKIFRTSRKIISPIGQVRQVGQVGHV